jgi:hypothetical protein
VILYIQQCDVDHGFFIVEKSTLKNGNFYNHETIPTITFDCPVKKENRFGLISIVGNESNGQVRII